MSKDEKPPTSAELMAEKHAEEVVRPWEVRNAPEPSAGNLEIQAHRSFLAGAEWQAAQVAEAVAKLEEVREKMRLISVTKYVEGSCDADYPRTVARNALAQLDAAIALLNGTK